MNSNEEFLKFMKSKDPFTLKKITKIVNEMWFESSKWSPTGPITSSPKLPKEMLGTILTAGTAGKAAHEAVEKAYKQQTNYNLHPGRTQSLMDETRPFIPSYNKEQLSRLKSFNKKSSPKSGPGLYEFLNSTNVMPYTPSASSLTSFSSFIMDWGTGTIITKVNKNVFKYII